MTSRIRLRAEYLTPTYDIIVLYLHSYFTQNLDLSAVRFIYIIPWGLTFLDPPVYATHNHTTETVGSFSAQMSTPGWLQKLEP